MLLSDRFHNDGKAGIYLNSIQQNALYHFKDQIINDKYTFETYDCDCGCKYGQLITIAEKDRYGISVNTKICPKCGLLMTNPRMNQDGYNKFYDSLYRQLYVGKYRPGAWYYETQRGRGKKILEYIKLHHGVSKIKSVLEIGCSAGGIVSIFKDYGIQKCKGVDLGSEYIAYGIEHGQDLENCNSLELITRKEKYDLIILNHVFEHFLNVRNELEVIKELLTDDGILYIEVPGVMDIHNGYQKDFLKYLQNAHVRHFSHKTLQQMLKWNGFDEICGDETAKGIYKKGTTNSEVIDYSSEILNYLQSTEKAFEEQSDNLEEYKELAERRQRNIEILDRWLTLNRDGRKIGDYFLHKGISEVAIYGRGFLGKQLQAELEKSNIRIAYIIDQDARVDAGNLKVYQPTDALPDVDTVLIATSGDYFEIKQRIMNKAIDVLTIQDVFNEVDI